MLVLGHRGWPSCVHPENTSAAVEAALRAGADGVEVDVRLTADGVAVCCHDDDLSRVGGPPGSVRATPWSQLRHARLAGGHPVPRLLDIAAAVAGRGQLVLDLKPEPRGGSLLRAAVAALRLAGVPDDDVVASSFDDRLLDLLALGRPGLARAAILDVDDPVLPALERARRRGDRAVHLPLPAVLRQGPTVLREGPTVLREGPTVLGEGAALARAGVDVRVWTVNRVDDARLCAGAGVTAVITDAPDLLLDGLRPVAA